MRHHANRARHSVARAIKAHAASVLTMGRQILNPHAPIHRVTSTAHAATILDVIHSRRAVTNRIANSRSLLRKVSAVPQLRADAMAVVTPRHRRVDAGECERSQPRRIARTHLAMQVAEAPRAHRSHGAAPSRVGTRLTDRHQLDVAPRTDLPQPIDGAHRIDRHPPIGLAERIDSRRPIAVVHRAGRRQPIAVARQIGPHPPIDAALRVHRTTDVGRPIVPHRQIAAAARKLVVGFRPDAAPSQVAVDLHRDPVVVSLREGHDASRDPLISG